MFEEQWHVKISNHGLEVINPSHDVQRIRLEAIQRIAVQTNDSGPFGSDVIWLVSDGDSTISFPMGAKGESDVLGAFQKIDGFDNLEFINSMSSVENNVFILLNRVKA